MRSVIQTVQTSLVVLFSSFLASSAAMAAVTIEPIGAGDMFRFFPEANLTSQISESFSPIDMQGRTKAAFNEDLLTGEVELISALDNPRQNVSLPPSSKGVSFNSAHVYFRIKVIDSSMANQYSAGRRLFSTTAKLTVKDPIFRYRGPAALQDYGSISVQCGTTPITTSPNSDFYWQGEERDIALSVNIDSFDFANCRDNLFVTVFARSSTSVTINEVNWYVSGLE